MRLFATFRTIYDFAFVTYADLPRGAIKNNSMGNQLELNWRPNAKERPKCVQTSMSEKGHEKGAQSEVQSNVLHKMQTSMQTAGRIISIILGSKRKPKTALS